ncbi:MAG: NAD-glutamate dehydrogenase domain-containing protein, partial [Pseudomonadota bacterium]
TQKSDNDGFNQLALSAKLNWNQITLLRAVYRYLKQIRFRYSQEYVIQTLAGNPNMACRIVRLFECKFDPDLKQDRDLLVNNIRSELKDGLERVTNIDEDRILSAYINLIESLLRTNYFQQHDPKHPERLSLKIDCSAVTRMPQPRPMVEIFVFSTQVEGVHLRGGRVARGGLRWSDRPEDFRTEVLGLVKAQIVKNAVIVPVGSKGGFIVRRLLDYLAEDQLNEVKTCYQTFIRGLLDLTDNYQGDDVIPPVRTLRYDDDDPYLVVAADKGTATFSDIANAVAEEYQYWLGDAFASGGKTGYDHKAMGITAKGAWESVKRLGRDLDLDTQSQPFSVVGIGDMSGDVFGNGMLLSRQIRLLAAFNHKHIFIDPSPDPENSFKERQRLFDLGQSNWDDYDPSVISAGGGVWPRTVKKIRLSETAQKALSISKNELSPEELIHEILKSPVDLLFNGGIGTYIKASYESHESVSDRANDILRVDANQLRCRMIGEGGNLGVTQFGRIEFSQRGGLCFTDAIDNSAGVDTSDHEVNIKILLNEAVKIGEISQRERNNLLSEMSDAVTALVLRDNYGQTQALSLESDKAVQLIHQHARAIRQLEENYGLNRALENLPDDQQISERIARHQGLTRPEIAVLLSHSKISIYQMLLNSNVPEDIFLSEDLKRYFPQVLSPRFDAFMRDHPLRREIIATHLTNNMINRVGPGFILRMNELTGAHPADTVRAYTACREIFRLRDCWHDIEGLDNKIRSQAQKELMHETRQLLEHATIWLLNYRPRPLDISATVEEFRDSIAQIKNGFPRVLAASNRLIQKRRVKRYLNAGTPPSIANTIAEFAALSRGLDIAELAHSEAGRLSDISTIYFDVGERIQLSWLSKKVRDLPITNHWHGLGRAALLNDLALTQKQITARILKSGSGKGKSAVRNWIAAHQADNERLAQMIQDLQKSSEFDFSMLSVAVSAANQLGTPNA